MYVCVTTTMWENAVTRLRASLEQMKEVATKARNTWDKLRRERDMHRMHHRRVVQEKEKLLTDLKRCVSLPAFPGVFQLSDSHCKF